MTKQGQLTLFIIIGLILLVAIGLVLYAQRSSLIPSEEAVPKVEEVAATVQPLQQFVQDCLKTTARQGLAALGARGGYIDPAQRFNPAEPTDGEAVQFAPDSQLKVPYWWYLKSPNTCTGSGCGFATEQPCLTRAAEQETRGICKSPSIEAQMDKYLTDNLPSCFRGFEQFSAQGFVITPSGEMKPETRVTRAGVVVLLTYPLDVRHAEETFALKDYVAELPVNLFEIYQLSTDITNLEANSSFLEHATRSLIDVFGRADPDALPPVSDLDFGFGAGTFWIKYSVLQKVQEMLTGYIPLLKVMNTGNYQFLPAPSGKDKKLYEILYNRGFTVPELTLHPSLDVKFSYLPWWKPYLDLNCNGQLCQPEGFSSTLGGLLFGVRRYNFVYDVSYPVLVEVTSPTAYGGEGYSFRFFLEENMRNNIPMAALDSPLPQINITQQASLLCDPDQRTGGNVTVSVRSSAGQPVDSAEIVYRCGAESCALGSSVEGVLRTAFPRCVGGFVSASHPDYAPAVKPFDVLDATDKNVDLVLGVPYPVDFSLRKWPLKKIAGNWQLDSSQSEAQNAREHSIIMLQRTGQPFEEPITVLGDVCGSPFSKAAIPCGNPPEDNSKGIAVYPGTYHATIYTFLYPSPALIIPPNARRIRTGLFKHKTLIIPPKPIVFDNTASPLMSGYAEFDWTVTDDDLKKAKGVEFYTIYFALDKVPQASRRIEDLDVMGSLYTYSSQYQDLLKPRIIQ